MPRVTNKTACEEAALVMIVMSNQGEKSMLAKRLRAEGRELKRLRKMVLSLGTHPGGRDLKDFEREAARIQRDKGRKEE